ncbi:adenylate/guanylate cyclase domain-containing protein [Roseibium sp.]|uniref:adenylate/guanylate cyclase domain-containing protein n=1 Tax=Roseibium sp. TaxID=1936156 RepID=UPI003B52FD2D
MGETPDQPVPLTWDPRVVRDWLLEEGRFSEDLHALTQALGDRLLAAGAPVWRLRLAMRTLHPLMTAIGSAWEREPGGDERVQSPHGLEHRPSYIGSPMESISKTGKPFRRRLTDTLGEEDHRILHELKARGATDYLGMPLRLAGGAGAVFVVTSDAEGGLADADVLAFERVCSAVTPIVEVFRYRDTSAAIAEAYLGKRTGQRVLDGQITRGDIEHIQAAILVSDIRDWTGMNMRLPAEEALACANRYFEVIAEAVESHGGEILKFLGDGVLAVFPTQGGDADDCAVCSNALAAAKAALLRADEIDPPLELKFGIGLHFGDVLYGNIGSATRIDFTVLGSAVNIAARLEGLCRQLDRQVLFTNEVAERLPYSVEALGLVDLKGVERPIQACSLL